MRDNHQKSAWHRMRVFVMVTLAAAAPLGLLRTVVPTAAAEAGQQPVSAKNTPTEQASAPTLLQTGDPQTTTPAVTKPADTILTWNATGTGDVQDVYDIRIATNATPDPLTGELTTGVVKTAHALTTAQYDARDLPEGAYYWQVRSCDAATTLLCKAWSTPWALQVDATAPNAPTATSTGKPYSQTVSFAGTAEPATTVTVAVDDKNCGATVADDGTWSCVFNDDFSYGDYTASTTATDKAGNVSPAVTTDFSVQELFVAPVITLEQLPPVLNVVPIDETPENKVEQKPTIAVIDTVNMGEVATPTPAAETPVAQTAALKPLSTDGGIVQSSENGWQIFGLPWFIWAGGAAGIGGAWWAFGVPVPRRLTSMLSS